MILVDTNILLRLIQIGHPHQQPALEAVALLRVRDREELVICAQTLYEMYAVCTRPVAGPNPGLGVAKFLKDQGATHVIGLPCVKSLRDSDNQ